MSSHASTRVPVCRWLTSHTCLCIKIFTKHSLYWAKAVFYKDYTFRTGAAAHAALLRYSEKGLQKMDRGIDQLIALGFTRIGNIPAM